MSYLEIKPIPFVSTAIYFIALSDDVRWRTNIPVFYVINALVAGLWVASVCALLRRVGR